MDRGSNPRVGAGLFSVVAQTEECHPHMRVEALVENTWQNCGFESHPLENLFGLIAQQVEHHPDKMGVVGSSPTEATQ